ncbi:hypothetical protein CH300_16880 [Rhodococcus sp. 15-1154-1]|nr:TIGR03619 family F420-dependent LLM class oxidoreductase [Rhodococcus sp. 15-1154-1]OZF02514.1 hypothetical protein CH300_16880 [Rhodococcus sp. 15-1154-1]
MTAPVSMGVHLPHKQPFGGFDSFGEMAQLAELCGMDSVWVGDHTVLVENATSSYPFSADGKFLTHADDDWFDWLVTLAYLAGVTRTVKLGVSVAITAHRHPVVLGKQIASLDRLSGGRCVLGVGTGWLAEEFAALGVPFSRRGARTDATLDVLKQVWSGRPVAGTYGPFELMPETRTFPTPVDGRVPILIGGDSAAAMRRIARSADGWIGTSVGGKIDPEDVRDSVRRMHLEADRQHRERSALQAVVRLAAPARSVGTGSFVNYLADLYGNGATGVTFDISWRSKEQSEQVMLDLRRSVDESTSAAKLKDTAVVPMLGTGSSRKGDRIS